MKQKRFATCFGSICIGFMFLAMPLTTGIAESAEEAYPKKPIKIVVGWAAGGGTDTWARATAQLMEKRLGVPIVIVNKPGAGSTMALNEVMTQIPPDGYTISGVETGTVLNATIGRMVCPDIRSEVALLGSMSGQDYCFGCRADTGTKTLKEFVDMCKASPGKMRVGHTGTVGTMYFILMMFKKEANINFEMLALGSDATLVKEVLGGRIQYFQGPYAAYAPYVASDVSLNMRMLPLAVAAEKRLRHVVPETPTFREYGYDVVLKMFQGMAVRKDTPKHIIEKLRSVFKDVATDPEYAKVLDKIGRGAMEYETPEETTKMTSRLVEMGEEHMKMEAEAKAKAK